MAPLTKRRWSTRRQGKRRATQKAFSKTYGKCDNCGELKQAHSACPKCGFYHGKLIRQLAEKSKKSEDAK